MLFGVLNEQCSITILPGKIKTFFRKPVHTKYLQSNIQTNSQSTSAGIKENKCKYNMEKYDTSFTESQCLK